ncbi:hypothetical protein [Saccharomonospora sp. CUA-673]|nr:hypothetical protein [Saccharomonospora sp. CUA-673]
MTFEVPDESPQSEIITVVGSFGGSADVTRGEFFGAPRVTTLL